MSMKSQAIQAITTTTEDPIRTGHLGRPSQNDHYFLHPKEHDSIGKQIWDCHDFLYDPHWYFGNTFKYALKGAVIGGLFGASMVLAYKQLPTLVLNKMFRHVKNTNFGSLQLAKSLVTPYAIGGALTGGAWYIWYHLIWAHNSNKGLFWDNVGGFAIFGAAAGAFLFHPKHYWAGFWFGGLTGFAHYYFYESNNYNNRATPGYYIPLGEGLSEEEKISQRNKDIVFELSQLPQIRNAQVYRSV